ncbi:MAG: hypothetical protein EBU46_01415 [Nitrosomonadaceae bacterium]|nr:hypothetical protein [Nitrosomonadaceae bacterium]
MCSYAMNNLKVQIKKPLIYDFVWNQAVYKMFSLAEDKGICNMVAAASRAVEAQEEASVAIRGESHSETELSKNREHAVIILDYAMNACDLDENTATRFDRLEKAKAMRDSINEYIARLEK